MCCGFRNLWSSTARWLIEPRTDDPVVRRRNLIVVAAALAMVIPLAVILPVMAMEIGFTSLLIPSAAGLFLSFLTLWLAQFPRFRDVAAQLIIWSILLLAFGHAYLQGGIRSPALLWIICIPYLAQMILPRGSARLASLITLVGLTLLFVIAPHGIDAIAYTMTAGVTFVCLFLGIVGQQVLAHYDSVLEEELVNRIHAQREAMLASQRMEALGRVAGGVAHDFNNLLTVISSYSAFLREAQDAQDVEQAVASIEESVNEATRLTSQLLAYGRRRVLSPELVDLGLAIRMQSDMVKRVLGESVTLSTVLPFQPVGVTIDPEEFPRILTSLAANARDAMPDGGHLVVRLSTTQSPAGVEQAVLEVSDDGVGMSEEDRARAFDPFFTTKPAGVGTGLGLAMVQGLVAQSGGTVVIESKLDEGTTVRVTLPRTELPQLDEVTEPVEEGRLHVLLVEDDPMVRRVAERVLSREFEVTAYESAEQALQALRTRPYAFDAIVSDIVLPGCSGDELIRRAQMLGAGGAFVLMSGYGPGKTTTSLPEQTFFVQKPFQPDELVQVVTAALSCRHGAPASGNPAVSKVEVETARGTLVKAKKTAVAGA